MKLIKIALIALLLPLQLLGQKDTLTNTLLWEVTGKGIKKSYVFGTMHLLPAKDFRLSNEVLKKLKKSDKLVMEIDLNKNTNPIGMMMKMFMKNKMTLDSLLTPEEVTFVIEKSLKFGLPANMIKKVKPMFISMLAESMGVKTEESDNSTKSYEFELMALAKKFKKETDGLETVEYQLSIFDSIPYSLQAKMLVEELKKEKARDSKILNETINLYKEQNIDAMVSVLNEGMGSDTLIKSFLLTKRNTNWISQMQMKMKANPCFFAVGAGHLGGNEGVIRLLMASGYTVKPLKNI
jgi:uncharacterized protein